MKKQLFILFLLLLCMFYRNFFIFFHFIDLSYLKLFKYIGFNKYTFKCHCFKLS